MKVLFVTGNHIRHFYLVNKFTNFLNSLFWSVKKEILHNHYNLLKKDHTKII